MFEDGQCATPTFAAPSRLISSSFGITQWATQVRSVGVSSAAEASVSSSVVAVRNRTGPDRGVGGGASRSGGHDATPVVVGVGVGRVDRTSP